MRNLAGRVIGFRVINWTRTRRTFCTAADSRERGRGSDEKEDLRSAAKHEIDHKGIWCGTRRFLPSRTASARARGNARAPLSTAISPCLDRQETKSAGSIDTKRMKDDYQCTLHFP
jgi:hypothetical protein